MNKGTEKELYTLIAAIEELLDMDEVNRAENEEREATEIASVLRLMDVTVNS